MDEVISVNRHNRMMKMAVASAVLCGAGMSFITDRLVGDTIGWVIVLVLSVYGLCTTIAANADVVQGDKSTGG